MRSWYTCKWSVVTHLSTNLARCTVTSLMQPTSLRVEFERNQHGLLSVNYVLQEYSVDMWLQREVPRSSMIAEVLTELSRCHDQQNSAWDCTWCAFSIYTDWAHSNNLDLCCNYCAQCMNRCVFQSVVKCWQVCLKLENCFHPCRGCPPSY